MQTLLLHHALLGFCKENLLVDSHTLVLQLLHLLKSLFVNLVLLNFALLTINVLKFLGVRDAKQVTFFATSKI